MFFGLLLHPLKALVGWSTPAASNGTIPSAHRKPRARLLLHWERGADGRPHGHWDRVLPTRRTD